MIGCGTTMALLLCALLLCSGCSASKGARVERDYGSHGGIIRVSPEILTEGERAWERADENTRRKTYFNDRLTFEILEITKAELNRNVSTGRRYHDQIGYVLEGSAIVTVDGKTRQVGPGGVYLVPSNVPFGLISASPKTVVLNVYTPPRQDLRPAPEEKPRFNDNEIRSVVYKWFSLFDEKAPIMQFWPFLAEGNFEMRLPGKTIRSWLDFQEWYERWRTTVETHVSVVERLDVSFDKEGRYLADVVVRSKTTLVTGETATARFRQKWVLTDAGAHPVIAQYVVEDIK